MRTTSFTDKLGYTRPFEESLDNMSPELKNAIWNQLELFLLAMEERQPFYGDPIYQFTTLIEAVWEFFGYTNDQLRSLVPIQMKNEIRADFFNLDAIKMYSLLQYVAESLGEQDKHYSRRQGRLVLVKKLFIDAIDSVLVKKQAACRFINDILTPITDGLEIEAVENAFQSEITGVKTHLQQAAKNLTNDNARGCVSEAVNAIESYARTILGDNAKTLGPLINPLCEKLGLDQTYSKLLGLLWGFSSNNARHSLESANVDINENDARLLLVTSASLINYMTIKNNEIGKKP